MPLRRIKFYLASGSLVLLLLSVAVLAWGILAPTRDLSPAQPPPSVTPRSMTDNGSDALPPLDEFTLLCQRKLQSPLYDPPPEPVAVEEAPPEPVRLPPLQITLLGTIVEPDRTVAMFATQGGHIELTRIGQTVSNAPNGPKVIDITADEVVVEYDGQQRTMVVRQGSQP